MVIILRRLVTIRTPSPLPPHIQLVHRWGGGGGLPIQRGIILNVCLGDCAYVGLDMRKLVLQWCANNKSADQPGHTHSLISTFVISLLESIISRLATSDILIFKLVSVAE